MIATLELLKKHVNADDFSSDDMYLSSLLESAEAWVVRHIQRDLDEVVEENGGVVPPELRQAVLLLAGYWYDRREAAGTPAVEAPYALSALLTPFRHPQV